MTRIFLTYAERDRSLGQLLYAFLKGAGHHIDVGPYGNLSQKVATKSEIILVLLSISAELDGGDRNWLHILIKNQFKTLYVSREDFSWALAAQYIWSLTDYVHVVDLEDANFCHWLQTEAEWASLKGKSRKSLRRHLNRARERVRTIVKTPLELICGPLSSALAPSPPTHLRLAHVGQPLTGKRYGDDFAAEPEIGSVAKDSGVM